MLKQRRQYADQVASNLFAAEHAIDAALAKTASLAGVVPATSRTSSMGSTGSARSSAQESRTGAVTQGGHRFS